MLLCFYGILPNSKKKGVLMSSLVLLLIIAALVGIGLFLDLVLRDTIKTRGLFNKIFNLAFVIAVTAIATKLLLALTLVK